jgi:citrate synthase
MSDNEQEPKRRHVGQYVASGDWSDYWTTKISHAQNGKINVRGYPVEELIENLNYSQSAYLLLKGELPDDRQAALFDLVLRSGMDQQFISAAAGAARFTASAFPESAIPALASGMLASGSVTGSPQEPAEMLMKSIKDDANDLSGSQQTIELWLALRGAVPGLGHPVHKEGEPRAITVRRLAMDLEGWGPHGQRLDAIEQALETQKRRKIPINLAGAMGAILADLEFDPLIIGGLGALAYGMSLLAHITEEIHEGVPLRIIPEELGAHYAGPPERHLPKEKS